MKLLLAAIASLVLVVSASATDFTVPLTDLDGKTIDDGTPDHKPFTLGRAAIVALITTYPDESGLKDIDKFKRAELASKINRDPHLVLSSEEITLVKMMIGKAFGPVVVYKAWPLLDGSIKPE